MLFRSHDSHSRDQSSEHDYSHGHAGKEHIHPYHGQGEVKIKWKSLLTLGVSGGLLPCPSAMLIMLSAISLNRIGFGLLLVVAFSVGLAGAMTGTGLLVLYGRQLLSRFGLKSRGSLPSMYVLAVRLLPLGSAAIISLIGLIMTARALTKM